MIQEEEQGWSFSEYHICSRCISDAYLKEFIKNSATDEEPCSFCRRRPSVPLDDVMEIIGNTVADYYNRAVNEPGYDGREGRLPGDHLRQLGGDGRYPRRRQQSGRCA